MDRKMNRLINNQKVLFITTKNLDYIRNTQEISMLRQQALRCDVIGSGHKGYIRRLWHVYSTLLVTHMSQYDTVFIGFAPQLILPFWGWKFKKVSIVIDFFISMYDTLCCDRRKIKEKSLLGRILHGLDKITLKKADAVICDTKAHGMYFHEEFGTKKDKIFTMYLQADTSIYYPRNLERPKALNGKFVILYFGSVLPLQGVDVVFKAMNRLRNYDNLSFFFIGHIEGKELNALRPISSNIKYIDWLPQEKLAEYIDMADLCLAGHFCKSIQKAHRTIPGKAYIYQAMNKPMILGDSPANHELFRECEMITFVEMGNERALADAIIQQSKCKRS